MHGGHTIAGMHAAGASGSLEQRTQAVVDGLEAIDPQYVLYLPSSTLKLVLAHFLTGGRGHTPGRQVVPDSA